VTIKTFQTEHETSFVQQASAAASANLVPLGSSHMLVHQRIAELGLDGLQVALVPFQSLPRGAGGTGHRDWRTSQFLLLPMTWKELVAQVRQEMDESVSSRKTRVVRFGDVSVDLVSMEVRRFNRLVRLTALEFKVLRFFVLNPDRAISRDELLDKVWGYENYPCTRTVDNHILRLRQKLEPDFARPVHFRTVHRIGYKLNP
jgi:DNA-binding winged helix-turn-helix (wHTH) protein